MSGCVVLSCWLGLNYDKVSFHMPNAGTPGVSISVHVLSYTPIAMPVMTALGRFKYVDACTCSQLPVFMKVRRQQQLRYTNCMNTVYS